MNLLCLYDSVYLIDCHISVLKNINQDVLIFPSKKISFSMQWINLLQITPNIHYHRLQITQNIYYHRGCSLVLFTKGESLYIQHR